MPHKFEIVILTRDRRKLLEQSLGSVLSQEANFPWKVIVSDNSQSECTSHWLAKWHPSVAVRRYCSLPADAHFREAIKNATADYVMLFHDDDTLLPGCIQTLVTFLEHNSAFSAACCNAFIATGDQRTPRTMLRGSTKDIQICSSSTLIKRYLNFWEGGVVPLSPYVFRRSMLKSEYIDFSTGGKYSDVVMLLNVLANGPFHWFAKPLAIYRIHEGSDNFNYAVHDKLRLFRTLHRSYGLRKNSFLSLSAKSDVYQKAFCLRPNPAIFFSSSLSRKKQFILLFLVCISALRMLRSCRYAKHVVRNVLIHNLQRATKLIQVKSVH